MTSQSARIAGAPISWGVCEVPGWGHQLAPQRVLREMAGVGLQATELGPDGFLPADPDRMAAVLAGHGLHAVGGFTPLLLHVGEHDPLPGVERLLEGYTASGAGVLVLSAVTGADGRTAIHALSNDIAGVFGVNASLSNGATLAQPFALANVADADPAQVHIALVSGDGQTAQVGTDYALPLVAKVADRFENVLSGRDVAFSVSGVGATLVNNSGTSDANGLVDTGTVTAGSTAGVVAVEARVDNAQCDSVSNDAVCAV